MSHFVTDISSIHRTPHATPRRMAMNACADDVRATVARVIQYDFAQLRAGVGLLPTSRREITPTAARTE